MKIIKHSLLMIKNTFRNYLLLSVTAVLSFSLMFGYLIFTDSNMYNKYKWILGADRRIICSYNSDSGDTLYKIGLVREQLDKMENTNYYFIKETMAYNSYGLYTPIQILPEYIWGYYAVGNWEFGTGNERINIKGGKEAVIEKDEIILPESMYQNLKACNRENDEIVLRFDSKDGNSHYHKYRIGGTYDSSECSSKDAENGQEPLLISGHSLSDDEYEISNITVVVNSESPKTVSELFLNNHLACNDVVEQQNAAIQEENVIINNKYVIATAIFVLLGINLYSAFNSALNDRKFEIGVKRAIGAGKWHIMFQFAVEGLAVMLFNVILSVIIVIGIAVVYKYIRFSAFNDNYVISMNGESVWMYIIFSGFLTVMFSLIFAYKSTNVEIVKYLKEEL